MGCVLCRNRVVGGKLLREVGRLARARQRELADGACRGG